MELNLIATGIELLGASVAKLTVDNTIVDIENDAQRILKYVLLKSFLIMELRNILQQICLTRQLPSQCFKNYTFIAGL